jgi:beta-phosphoglucomutase-like phosphatase (HAD superfamily)
MYLKAVELLDLPPSDCVMVAAHAYDLRAAAKMFVAAALNTSRDDIQPTAVA